MHCTRYTWEAIHPRFMAKSPTLSCWCFLLFDFDDGFDFHSHVERKGVRAHSRAGVDALVTKHFANSVGRAVDDRWLLGETIDAIDKAHELHYALDLVQITHFICSNNNNITETEVSVTLTHSYNTDGNQHRTLECSHEAERHVMSSVIALLRRQVFADLAHNKITACRLG